MRAGELRAAARLIRDATVGDAGQCKQVESGEATAGGDEASDGCKAGEDAAAADSTEAAASSERPRLKPKLRTFAPLLQAMCAQGDVHGATEVGLA